MTRLWRFLTGLLVVSTVLAALAAGDVFAQATPPSELMAEANALYEDGEYAGAAQQYEFIAELGYRDAAVHYNLGNAYLKSGDLGRAILNYLRAEERSPRDPDVAVNLEIARGRTVDQLEAEGDTLVASVSNLGRRWATVGELGAAALLLWAASALAVCALILRPVLRRSATLRVGVAVSFTAMLASLALLLTMLYSNPYDNTGVVVTGTVEVLSGPGPQYSEAFALHSGAQVRLVGSRHGWLQVALPGGELQGWMPAHAIEAVG